MRKKKHGEERLAVCSEFLVEKPNLSEICKNTPVWLEIGAGKGGFAIGMTKKYPDVSYFAMERVTDCVVLAAESAKRAREEENACKNLYDMLK